MTKTHKLIVAGDTYKARTKLKDMGFAWNAGAKSWSVDIAVDGDMIHADKFYNTSIPAVRSTIKCYAKTENFTIEAVAAE